MLPFSMLRLARLIVQVSGRRLRVYKSSGENQVWHKHGSLRQHYHLKTDCELVLRLATSVGYTSSSLDKITLNMGVSEAVADKKIVIANTV
jgi:hypothetical protein